MSAALRDGHSTAGTLGIGLGAIRRLADFSDLYSVPGHGTALAARFRRVAGPRPQSGGRACSGRSPARPSAATATARSGRTARSPPCCATGSATARWPPPRPPRAWPPSLRSPAGEPAALLERVHRRMSGTRGGAVGIVQIGGQLARFAGLGNVAASIVSGGQRQRAWSRFPGIAGQQARTIRQFEYEVPPGAAVILHSDGISSRWEAAALPGIEARDPLLIAAVLLALAGIHRDDAGVLVLKP